MFSRLKIYYFSVLEFLDGKLSNFFSNRKKKQLDKKQCVINTFLDLLAKESGLYEKYKNANTSNLKPIGNRVWMFWYSGFESAPPVVKKCAELTANLKDIDLVLIDKNNLEQYFVFEGRIKELFEKGKISLPHLADIIRCQLLCRYGGFWFDATLFCTQKDFISTYRKFPYFSVRHYFGEYYNPPRIWSTWCCASGKDNPLFSFLYEMFIFFFNQNDIILNYIQFDYTWFYIYKNFDWASKLIDSVSCIDFDASFITDNFFKKFDEKKWNLVLSNNVFLKLNYKLIPDIISKGTYLEEFFNYK